MKRNYNKKIYGFIKKTGSFARDKIAPDFGAIFSTVFGALGKIIAFVFTNIIAKPLHWLTFSIVGLLYDKKSDSPYKGSILYTVLSIFIMFIIASFLKNLSK